MDADGGVEKWGVQVLLQRMAAHVSDQGYSVGILDRIKNLNNFLERAAAALESTKASFPSVDTHTFLHDVCLLGNVLK